MFSLFDELTEYDKKALAAYLSTYGGAACGIDDLKNVLKSWADSKKTLYRALGNKLRVKVPINIALDKGTYFVKLSEIYEPISRFVLLEKNPSNNIFIKDFFNYLKSLSNKEIFINNMVDFVELFSYENIYRKTLSKNFVFFKGDVLKNKALTLQKGEKIIKAIQKVLKYYGYKNMDLFEKWRNNISDLNTTSSFSSNLVFSIHPLDFLTLSDNNCGWSSCFSLTRDGAYSFSVIEMMNSNIVMVVYLESDKKYEANGYKIPNKSWRCLFYVHKKILCAGKSYPYYSEILTKKALSEFYKLLRKNLHWKYQYREQKYGDMLSCDDDYNIYNTCGKKILLVTNRTYNDLLEDKDTPYWCYRNHVKNILTLSISGDMTCLRCGKTFLVANNKKICSVCSGKE